MFTILTDDVARYCHLPMYNEEQHYMHNRHTAYKVTIILLLENIPMAVNMTNGFTVYNPSATSHMCDTSCVIPCVFHNREK